MAARSSFLLGLDYSEWAGVPSFNTQQIAADGSGALYILAPCTVDTSPSCITKVSADGKTVVWRNTLGFPGLMAVDPAGGVYVATTTNQDTSVVVEKLSADGASVLWQTQLPLTAPVGAVGIAVDSTGRAFVTGSGVYGNNSGPYVVRLNAAGAVDFTAILNLVGQPADIAVDPTGSYVAVLTRASGLAQLSPASATWAYSTVPPISTLSSPNLAVAPNGDAVVYAMDLSGNWWLQRIGPTGAAVFAETVPGSNALALGVSIVAGLALDAAGNAYITGYSGPLMRPVLKSLAMCGSAWLSVYAPDGSLLQSTYIPGAANTQFSALIATSPNSAVFVLDWAGATFAPTQSGPFPGGVPSGATALLHFSPQTNAQTFPLACVGNAASFVAGAIAPGEVATLFGNGLGPQQGVQTAATAQSPFPLLAGGVQVTVGGTPAPLLWVQDAQINFVAPWSVTGQTTQVCVSYNPLGANVISMNCVIWPVAQTAPGVFTVDGVHAAALNQDGTVNSASNPAPAHSIVSVFATGLGPINPPQADGSLVELPLPANVLPLELQIGCGGIPCIVPVFGGVFYGGPAPYLLAGTTQINFYPVSSGMHLVVQGSSNEFQVYLAGQ